jgi:hypothetical protein
LSLMGHLTVKSSDKIRLQIEKFGQITIGNNNLCCQTFDKNT